MKTKFIRANIITTRGASSTLMQEIAQGYVSVTSMKVFKSMFNIPGFLGHSACEDRVAPRMQGIATNRLLANTSTKSCHVSMHDSWKKKLGNGGKFTRFAITTFFSVSS